MEQAYIVALSADHGWCVAFKGHDGTVVWKFMRHERKCPHFGASRQQCLFLYNSLLPVVCIVV